MKKLPSIAVWVCAVCLIFYGVHYQTSKTLFHLSSLISLIFIIGQYRSKNIGNISRDIKIFIGFVVCSAIIIFVEHVFFRNKISDWVFKDFFYPIIIIIPILIVLALEGFDKRIFQFSAIISLVVMCIYGLYQTWLHGKGYRVRGEGSLPLIFATNVAMLTAFTIIVAAHFRENTKLFLLTCAVSVMGLVTVFLTGSRGPAIAIASFIMVSGVYFAFVERGFKKIIVVLIIFFIATPFFIGETSLGARVLNGIKQYESKPDDKANSHGVRIEMWRGAINSLAEHPFAGVGFGLHQKYFNEKLQVDPGFIAPAATKYIHLHNDVINAVVWFGIPLGLLFVSFFAWLMYVFSKSLAGGFYMQAGFAVAYVFLVCGLTNSPMIRASSLTLMLLLCVFCLSAIPQKNKTS
ncbi:MAG: O-antigen ligase family protein [Oceanospirillaceae bacterium]|nr:O-antigen ligase family protein [Oceanospirillaceae bacterium]MCP5334788.1 O-antigen ligase family protein [Oceanospirillaceae bacterium]MCP5350498.1 O-antigen ligase family protein [Oceanospirillaceae bacterium]